MNRDFYINCHEELIAAYLEHHPNATEDEAYDATSDMIYGYAVDKMAYYADMYHDMSQENDDA